jgi:hypothetical protein
MRYSKFNLVILMAALLCVSGSAMAAKVATGPGYIDLSFIEIPEDAEEIQDIDLSLVLKDVVREAKANDDLEIAELLTMVHSLRLRSFSVDKGSVDMARQAVEKVSSILKRDDWDTLMKFKDGGELTTINIKYHDDNMVGLMVVVFDPDDEVLFVNVVGDLDLGKLMKLAGELDSEDLEDYLDKVDGGRNIHID